MGLLAALSPGVFLKGPGRSGSAGAPPRCCRVVHWWCRLDARRRFITREYVPAPAPERHSALELPAPARTLFQGVLAPAEGTQSSNPSRFSGAGEQGLLEPIQGDRAGFAGTTQPGWAGGGTSVEEWLRGSWSPLGKEEAQLHGGLNTMIFTPRLFLQDPGRTGPLWDAALYLKSSFWLSFSAECSWQSRDFMSKSMFFNMSEKL